MTYAERVAAVVRRGLWPDNPNSVAMARAVMAMARAMDAAPPERRRAKADVLRHLLNHFVGCSSSVNNTLDAVVVKHVTRKARSAVEWLYSHDEEE